MNREQLKQLMAKRTGPVSENANLNAQAPGRGMHPQAQAMQEKLRGIQRALAQRSPSARGMPPTTQGRQTGTLQNQPTPYTPSAGMAPERFVDPARPGAPAPSMPTSPVGMASERFVTPVRPGAPAPSTPTSPMAPQRFMKAGGVVKGRGDGIATRGKTKGRFC